MWRALFVAYVVVEISALVAVASAIGVGWTILAVIGAFLVGLYLAGSQVRRSIRQLRRGRRSAGGAAADGVLIALGTLGVVVPGLVSSVIGLLLLLPPTRAVLRPVLAAVAVRQLGRRAPLITVASAADGVWRSAASPAPVDYIDGEVIATEEGPVTHQRNLPAQRA